MKNIVVIVIDWEKIAYDESIICKYCNDSDYGIYQVYGHHPAYGENSLLYIGKASAQPFAVRLKERFEFTECAARPAFIHLGRIVKSSEVGEHLQWDVKRWQEVISYTERILIKAHLPAMNKQENTGLIINEFPHEDFLIINWGEFGKLLPETSTLRLSYLYWNYEVPISKNDWVVDSSHGIQFLK
jgi:hypothetical protein